MSELTRVYALKIKYPANWNTSKIAVFNDAFLTPRPWWMVIAEKYEWDSASESSLRLIRMLQMDKQFMAMAAVQYPTNCEDHMYTLRCTGGFNEYGAEYGNIESMYIAYSGSIVDETVGSNAHWVHDNYCPNTLNKFRCAFLPPHNCTVKEFPCSRPIMCFDKATVDAKSVDDFRSKLPPLHLEDISSQLVIFYLHESQNYNTFVRKVKKINISPSLYYIGLLFRQNYDYRSRVAQFVNEFRKSNHFYSNQSCIAFHIRRGDRVIDGKNMIEHCKYIVSHCMNETNTTEFIRSGPFYGCIQYQFDYFGLGCHTAVPYGGLSFDMYMKAAEIISKNTDGTKTIVVMTNDHAWSVEKSLAYLSDWKIHVTPQPPHFRGSSVEHGVINQGSIELTQQCSSLIGHYGSAFTQLLERYMCFRHGPSNDLKFGTCPIRFDFSELK